MVLSAADQYRVTGQGRFTSFLSKAGITRKLIREVAAAYGSPVTLDRNSAKVKAALGRIREEYVAAHMHPPAEDELAALVVESFVEAPRTRLRKAPPGPRGRQLATEARAALVKTGVWRALGEIPALRLLDRSVMLDEPVGEDGATRGSLLPADPAGEQGSESTLDLVYRIALGGNQWARPAFAARCGVLEEVEGGGALGDLPRRKHSLAGLAEAVGAERSQLRQVLDHGTSRLAAPHAQWAYLASGALPAKARPSRKVGGIPAEMFADR